MSVETHSGLPLPGAKKSSTRRSTHWSRIVMVGARTSVGWLIRLMTSRPSTVFPEPGAATKCRRLLARKRSR